VIVHLHAHLLDPTLDIFFVFTGRKQVLGIVLLVGHEATVGVTL